MSHLRNAYLVHDVTARERLAISTGLSKLSESGTRGLWHRSLGLGGSRLFSRCGIRGSQARVSKEKFVECMRLTIGRLTPWADAL